MAFGDKQLAELDPIERAQDAVVLKRSIAVYERGLIVSYAIAVQHGDGVTVNIRDDIAANWEVGQIAYHPSHSPDTGETTGSSVAFSVDVTPNDYRLVKFGVRPAPEKSIEAIESDQSFSSPSFESIEPLETSGAIDPDMAGSTLISGSSESDTGNEPSDRPSPESPEPRSTGTSSSDGSPIQTREAGSSDGPRESSTDDSILPSNSSATSPTAPELPPNGGSIPDDPETLADLFGGFDNDPNVADPSLIRSGPTTDRGAPTSDEPTAVDPNLKSTPSFDTDQSEESLTTCLLRELEAETISPDERQRLASRLGDLLDQATDSGAPHSLEVRLQRLEARIEEFSAYIEGLGDLFDEENPKAVLADMHEDIEALEREVEHSSSTRHPDRDRK